MEGSPVIEIPPLFNEAFKHVMFPLIDRFNDWLALITNLKAFFHTKQDASNTLCNAYSDAAKCLREGQSKNPVIKLLTPLSSPVSTLHPNSKKYAGWWKDRLAGLFKQKYCFEYLKEGGVMMNLARINDEAEQMALLEEKHRKFILTEILAKLNALKEGPVDERLTKINDWKVKYEELQQLKIRVISAYENLVTTSEKYKVNRDSFTPGLQDDPNFCRMEYQSLRDRYVHNSNTLQFAAQVHLAECKTCESTIIQTIQSVILEYTTTTEAHNDAINAVLSTDKSPFDEDEEWKYFLSQYLCVPPLPVESLESRNLRFANDDHPKTKPMAEARLFLDPVFPWSFKSKRAYRQYIVTHGGYLIKVGRNNMLPARAFRLLDCYVMPNPAVCGRQSFLVTGIDCINTSFWSHFFSGRKHWRFWGSEKEVSALLNAAKSKMPVVMSYGYNVRCHRGNLF